MCGRRFPAFRDLFGWSQKGCSAKIDYFLTQVGELRLLFDVNVSSGLSCRRQDPEWPKTVFHVRLQISN